MLSSTARRSSRRVAALFIVLLAACGGSLAGEFQASTVTTGRQRTPAVAMDGAGRFIVVWEDGSRDGSGSGIFARRYDALGAPMGDDFPVNTTTSNDQVRRRNVPLLEPGERSTTASGRSRPRRGFV